MSWIVLAVLALVVGLVLRSMWRDHRSGGSRACGGDCSHCKGCH